MTPGRTGFGEPAYVQSTRRPLAALKLPSFKFIPNLQMGRFITSRSGHQTPGLARAEIASFTHITGENAKKFPKRKKYPLLSSFSRDHGEP